MTPQRILPLYCLNDPLVFTPPYENANDSAFADVLTREMAGWQIQGEGVWLHCSRITEGRSMPAQGWKIHLSVDAEHLIDVLPEVARLCLPTRTPFKVVRDRKLARITQSALWPRPQCGKALAVYPADDTRFLELLASFADVLRGVPVGPHILSDRKFPGSEAVYFRYGSFRQTVRAQANGRLQPYLRDEAGDLVAEVRAPYYVQPDFARCPVPPEPGGGGPQAAVQLCAGRFHVRSAKAFTAAGGVYLADDTATNKQVLIKEARRNVYDQAAVRFATLALTNEFEILESLRGLGVCPEPILLFPEEDSLFLVEEYIDNVGHLGSFITRSNPLYTLGGRQELRDYYSAGVGYLVDVAAKLEECHRRGVIFGDLSFTNVLCTGGGQTRLIDLGAAFRPAFHPPTLIRTPGMGRPSRWDTSERDVMAFGYLITGLVGFTGSHSELVPQMPLDVAAELTAELGWGGPLVDLAAQCIRGDGGHLLSIAEVRERLTALVETDLTTRHPVREATTPRLSSQSLIAFVEASAGPEPAELIFPCDPLAYERNVVSLAWGVGGVLFALSALGREIRPEHHRWWRRRATSDEMPAGLYTGHAGSVWTAVALDDLDLACEAMNRSLAAIGPGAADSAYLDGLSGVGLAALWLWRHTKEACWLMRAEELGRQVSAQERRPTTAVGLASGGAGVSLFFLRLTQDTGERRWLEDGLRALRRDLGSAVRHGGFTSFHSSTDPAENRGILRPYWHQGSAGILAVLAAWLHSDHRAPLDADARVGLEASLRELVPDCSRLFTASAGLLAGFSGLGMALLDAHAALGEPDLAVAARRVARGVAFYRVPRAVGAAVSGDQAVRVTADLGTGAAGVALFLRRVEDSAFPNHLPGFHWPVAARP